jgi:hypothetical protein
MAEGERGSWLLSVLTPSFVMAVAFIFIIGYFGILVASNAITSYRLSREEAALRAEIEFLRRREARLQAVKQYLDSDAFIEAAARENGLVRPGEIAVVPLAPVPDAEPRPRPGEPWWARYLAEPDRR